MRRTRATPPNLLSMKTSLAFLLGALAVASLARGASKLTVTASHSLDAARPSETLLVPWSEVRKHLPDAAPDKLIVKDAQGRVLTYQFTNFQPEDKTGRYDDVLFQYSFAAGEKSASFTIERSPTPVLPVPTKTFARYVPERLDDFAFENDRLAHRMYGPGLDTPAAGKSRMISSGIDIWTKRVAYPVIDRWYLRGHDNYHIENGEGLDFYSVGTGRGCGGTGIWDGAKLRVSHNWKTWKVVANGPVRTIFELGYAPWDAGNGVMVSEVKRFTLDAGHNLHRVESTFTFEGAPSLVVALGLGKHKDVPATIDRNRGGWLAQWEKYPRATEGELGTAVMLASGAFQDFAEDDLNQLALVRATSGTPVRYALGAGWSLGSPFTSAAAWNTYLSAEAARLRAPVTVAVTPVP